MVPGWMNETDLGRTSNIDSLYINISIHSLVQPPRPLINPHLEPPCEPMIFLLLLTPERYITTSLNV